jgi:membrane-bound serine protease (ClpP class)
MTNHFLTRPIGLLGLILLVFSTVSMALQAGDGGTEPASTPALARFADSLGDGPVFVVPIDGLIDNGLARYIDRAIRDADSAGASVIVFHIDTFGGLVAAADLIRKAVLNAPVPTVAFIDKNAASAGALISYATNSIVMVPGASIGAATVVEGGSGEAAPDKYQSYMRGLMRSTAEARGRDPRIAEAMVDQNLVVPGVSEAGQVLTLSANEAFDLGVADAVIETKDLLLAELGLGQAEIVQHRATSAERILRFFGSPIVQSVLMLMMLGGLYFELQSPGVGFPGMISLLGAALFFAPHYMLGFVHGWEVVLFFIGVLLILVEVFILPGFGVAGISGLVLVVFSLGASLIGNVGFSFPAGPAITSAILTMAVTMVLFVALAFSLSKYLPRSERFNILVLTSDVTGRSGESVITDESDSVLDLLGENGIAVTVLRPGGVAEFGDRRFDVVSSGEYIPAGVPVRVVNVKGRRIEVRAATPIAEKTASV